MQKGSGMKLDETITHVYDIIVECIDRHGYPPTLRELMDKVGVSSTSTIKYYLDKLEQRNLIHRTSNKNRAIEIVKDSEKKDYVVKNIPLLGEVAAGRPIFAFENYDVVYEMSDNIFNSSGDMFILSVKGDSMVNAGILDKDRIVVRKQSYANNNDIVVAMINGSATVKRFFNEGNIIRLQPENDYLKPIYSRDVVVLGKVIGLLRDL